MQRKGVRRVVPMVLGWEHLALRISMPLIDEPRASILMREPVPGLLLEVDGGWLLVDSGFNAPLVKDRSHYDRYWGNPHVTPELAGPRDADPLESAFALAGVDPRDVVGVCISHFHNDHVGGVRHFAGKAPVYVQRAEYETANADHHRAELTGAMFRIDWDDPRIDWRLLDGDAAIADGVTAILTAGHTAGHQSFVVDLDAAVADQHAVPGYVFACDAADLQENLDADEPVMAWSGDHAVTREGLHRLRSVAAEHGYRVVPGHDPVVWPAFAGELGVDMLTEGTLGPAFH